MRLPGLEARLRSVLFAGSFAGFLAWLGTALSAWCLATAAFLLLSPPEWAASALLLVLLSVLPCFLFWPKGREGLVMAMREVDADCALEAVLEAPEGPARPLIEARAIEVDGLLPYLRKPRPKLPRSLRALAGASLLSFALLEFTAVLVLHAPTLSYGGPKVVAASGLRKDDEATLPEPGAQTAEEDQAGLSQTPEARGELKSDRRAEKEASLEASLEAKATPSAESGDPPSSTEEKRAATPEAGEEAGSAAKGRSASGEEGEDSEDFGLTGKGYSGSGKDLPRSPLVDYRARVFQALTDSGGHDLVAGEGLDLGTLREYEARYFASFVLTSGSLPRDDAWEALVKRRWLDTSGDAR